MARLIPRTGEEEVRIPIPAGFLDATLAVPQEPRGMVLFAHGTGSSRGSPRNRFVARVLREAHLGTLLLDLLTAEEEAADVDATLRWDVSMLAERLLAATDWVRGPPDARELGVGYFGASTGAAAALLAAARRPDAVAAVVSRGGRPDLAGAALWSVQAPTLLIVGGADHVVLELNRQALQRLTCDRRLEVVPGASHLFEEPGALAEAARLARDWLERHLAVAGRAPA